MSRAWRMIEVGPPTRAPSMPTPTPSCPPHAHASLSRLALPRLAAAWLALAALDVVLGGVASGTAWEVDAFGPAIQVGLALRETLLLAFVVALAGTPVALGSVALARAGRRRLAGTVALVAGTAGALFVVASWAAYRSTGQLPGEEAARLALASPGQLAQHALHMEHGTALGAPVAALAAGALVGWLAPWAAGRLGRRGARALQICALAVLAAGIAGAAYDYHGALARDEGLAHDPASGFSYHGQEFLEVCRDLRSGPAARWFAELRDHVRPVPNALDAHVDGTLAVERRPLVALEDWARDARAAPHRRWDVIVAIVESLRPDQLRCTGGVREVMPTVERLAGEGVAYTRCYSQSTHSNYADLCPLSGHYPLRERRTHLYPRDPLYPRVLLHDLLSVLGWRTAVISSQNEDWGRMRNYLDTGRIDHFFHAPDYEGDTRIPRADQDQGFVYFARGPVKRSGKIDDRITVDEAIRWTGSLASDEPYYCYLNLQNSHTPYEVPADFPRRFLTTPLDFEVRFSDYPRERASDVKNAYADSLAYSDHQLARLVAHLERAGRWDRTLVVVTGDTGQAFFEHGFAAHANALFEEVTRVPLVVRAPGLVPTRDDRLAQHVDVPPTVLGLLGLPPHPAHQGHDLRRPGRPDEAAYLVSQCALAHQVAIVWRGLKLVHDERSDRFALFDLMRDPEERHPVSPRDEVFWAVAKRHGVLARLATWRALQLGYYADADAQQRHYPPVLGD